MKEFNVYVTSMFDKEAKEACAVANIMDEDGKINEFFAKGTNSSIALLKAINAAIATMPDDINRENELIVHTDSSYIISCLYNMHNWFFKGMKKKDGNPVANPDLIMELLDLTTDKATNKEVLEYPAQDPGVLKLKIRIVRLTRTGVVEYV